MSPERASQTSLHTREGGESYNGKSSPSCSAREHLCDLKGPALDTAVLFPRPTLHPRDRSVSEAGSRANELPNL